MSSIIYLMGPTASGKTALAVELVKRFPYEIISVDSAMVYRGLDIGTAKPDDSLLKIAPHRLINLLDPKDTYSAGQFRLDALREIRDIIAQGKIPLLVGGTMLYFRVLMSGLAILPPANAALRAELQSRAAQAGWEALHADLMRVDPDAAKRIHPRDSQRIQRALEVYHLTGQSLSDWQVKHTHPLADYQVHAFAIAPSDRARLHERIAVRFHDMLEKGWVEEVRGLYQRGDLSPDLPAIRSVGYRQIWAYLSGETTDEQMRESAIAATRQLAKRQLTWLRAWPSITWFDSDKSQLLASVTKAVGAVK